MLQVPCFIVLLAWDADRQNAGTPDGLLRLLPQRRTPAVPGSCNSAATPQAVQVSNLYVSISQAVYSDLCVSRTRCDTSLL
jgi:hypothetical protein